MSKISLTIIIVIIFLGFVFYFINISNEPKVKKSNQKDYIIKDYRIIKTAIMEYKKINGVLPDNIKNLDENYRKMISQNNYSLSFDKKHLIVYNIEKERAERIIEDLGNNSYYEGGFLYLGFIKSSKDEIKPQAVITMVPDTKLTTTTHIDWNYNDSKSEKNEIKDVEWDNKHTFYEVSGTHKIRLKIKDRNDNWSEWTEKTIELTEEVGIKNIVSGDNCFIILYNNGNCNSYFFDDNVQKYTKRNLFNKKHISSISGGNTHIVFSTYDQRIYSIGKNQQGQLGLGHTDPERAMTRVDDIYDARRVFAGGNTSAVLCYSGKLYAWGENKYGQIGDGTIVSKMLPSEIKSIIGIKKLAISKGHTIGLLINGNVMTWGLNQYGELGNGTRGNQKAPITLDIKHCKDIAAGENFSMALTENGQIYSWGKNEGYQLGKNTIADESFPSEIRNISEIVQIEANGAYAIALDRFGKVYVWGSCCKRNVISKFPKHIESIDHIQFIALNSTHVFTITYEGEIRYWEKGQEDEILTLK